MSIITLGHFFHCYTPAKKAFRSSLLENYFNTEEILQEIPYKITHGKDILSGHLGREVWWCDLALVLELSLMVRTEKEPDSPFQLLPGKLSSRRHTGTNNTQRLFSATQTEGKELVEVSPGFAEAPTFGLVGRSKCMEWSAAHGKAVKTTKITGKRSWFLKHPAIQNIFKGAKHYPLHILMWSFY